MMLLPTVSLPGYVVVNEMVAAAAILLATRSEFFKKNVVFVT